MEIGSQDQGLYPKSAPGTGELKEKATQLTHTARERAMSTLDGQKEQVGKLLDRVAQRGHRPAPAVAKARGLPRPWSVRFISPSVPSLRPAA